MLHVINSGSTEDFYVNFAILQPSTFFTSESPMITAVRRTCCCVLLACSRDCCSFGVFLHFLASGFLQQLFWHWLFQHCFQVYTRVGFWLGIGFQKYWHLYCVSLCSFIFFVLFLSSILVDIFYFNTFILSLSSMRCKYAKVAAS